MMLIRFNDCKVTVKDVDNYGVKYFFTCLTCKNDFDIETFENEDADKIKLALNTNNSNGRVICQHCLKNQIKNN